jgi:hypothetical protein
MKRLSFALLLGILACEPAGATQVMLRLRTRDDVRTMLRTLEVRIATRDGQGFRQRQSTPIALAGLTWPIDVPVLPGRGKPDDGEFEVIVEGRDAAGNRIVETRAITNFVPHREKLLVMMLAPCTTDEPGALCLPSEDCHGEACATCDHERGTCGTTPVIPGKTLPELDPDGQTGSGIAGGPVGSPDLDAAPDAGPSEDGGPGLDGGVERDGAADPTEGGATVPHADGSVADASLPPSDGGHDHHEPDGGSDVPASQRCPTSEARPSQPFGIRTVPYLSDVTWPRDTLQGELELGATNLYDRWKQLYLAETGCGDGMVYVRSDQAVPTATTSDAHGYAMLVLAWMAGHDGDARRLFDGMVRYYRAHPAEESDFLMAHRQGSTCASVGASGTNSEADMDIAFALLLANKQWGSGETDYYGLAQQMVGAILEHDAMPTAMQSGSRPLRVDTTPTSAFAPAHFASFATVRDRSRWDALRADGYALLRHVAEKYSKNVGLWPDFIVNVSGEEPRPAQPLEVEDDWDGAFGHRASRAALRMALRRLTAPDPEAKTLIQTATLFIMGMSIDCDPLTLDSSYSLKGSRVVEGFRMPFAAPLGPAALLADDTDTVTGLWGAVRDTEEAEGTYYSDTIQLLAAIIMSGAAWVPEAVACPAPRVEGPPPTLTLTPGAEGKDSRLCSLPSQRATPGGSIDRFAALAWSFSGEEAVFRSLIDFDLSAVPPGAIVTRATLKLFAELTPALNQKGHSQYWGTNEVFLRRITSAWDEDTVTWDSQPTTSVSDQLTLPKSRYNSQDYEVDVTAFVKQKLLAPHQNFGFAMQLVTEERYRAVNFASGDHKEASLHPRLELTYELPSP